MRQDQCHQRRMWAVSSVGYVSQQPCNSPAAWEDERGTGVQPVRVVCACALGLICILVWIRIWLWLWLSAGQGHGHGHGMARHGQVGGRDILGERAVV